MRTLTRTHETKHAHTHAHTRTAHAQLNTFTYHNTYTQACIGTHTYTARMQLIHICTLAHTLALKYTHTFNIKNTLIA